MQPILRTQGITKRFPGVVALDGVDFEIHPGEVQLLLGENGAGKSTLVKILSGACQPDEGEILMDGKAVQLISPQVARRMGISTVYQEPALVPDLSVAQNIFLGREEVSSPLPFLRRRAMEQEARRLLRMLDVEIAPETPVRCLGPALRQVVEIVKALATRSPVLFLDEPTSSLSAREVQELFLRIRRLKSDGVGICYISHRLEEIPRVADRITVMRDGRVVARRLAADTPVPELIRLMVGRELAEEFPERRATPSRELFRVERLSVPGKVQDVSFAVHTGEVLGIFGLVGAGRTELLRGIFGLEPGTTGRRTMEGRPATVRSPRDAIALGLGLVPEDRHGQGLVLSMNVRQNLVLAALESCTRWGFLSFRRIRDLSERYFKGLRIKAAGPHVQVSTLSGGNQQKVVIARSLATRARVLLMDEPTSGIDVGAKREIYELINSLVSEGKAVVLVSSEMPEILGMSDRILVMRQGRFSAEFPRFRASQEALLSAALPLEKEIVA